MANSIERREIDSVWDIPFGEPELGKPDLSRVLGRYVTGPNEVTSRVQQADGTVIDYVTRGGTPHPEIEEYFWDEMERDIDPNPLPDDPFLE